MWTLTPIFPGPFSFVQGNLKRFFYIFSLMVLRQFLHNQKPEISSLTDFNLEVRPQNHGKFEGGTTPPIPKFPQDIWIPMKGEFQ